MTTLKLKKGGAFTLCCDDGQVPPLQLTESQQCYTSHVPNTSVQCFELKLAAPAQGYEVILMGTWKSGQRRVTLSVSGAAFSGKAVKETIEGVELWISNEGLEWLDNTAGWQRLAAHGVTTTNLPAAGVASIVQMMSADGLITRCCMQEWS